MIGLERDGDVLVLRMDDGENRFNRNSVDALNAALDQAESAAPPVALVTTGEGKFFSNGLDLDWMQEPGAADDGFLDDVHRLLVRMLTFPAITVAAVNGHAFAAGAMFATAHDFLVMREDRGYWCLPEVDLGLPLTPVMHAVIAAKLPRTTTHEAMLTGQRYTADEAQEAGIVHLTAPVEDVVPTAVKLAQTLVSKHRGVVVAHKELLYGHVTELL